MPDLNDKEFRAHCLDQIDQLGALAPQYYRFLPDGTLRAYVDWLVVRCGGDEVKATRFTEAALDHFEEFPSLAELRKLWDAMFPKPKPAFANPDCPECAGTGWKPGPLGGVEKCCGVPPAAAAEQQFSVPMRRGGEASEILNSLSGKVVEH